MNSEITIKETSSKDIENIFSVEKEAFGRDDVVNLAIDLLNDSSAEPRISLLAYHKEKAIGHIIFTRATIEGMNESPLIHILAPLAIIPDYQNKGIGGILIKEGIKRLKELDSKIVFVLGHIEYYPKYGFINDAQKFGFSPTYPIPEEVKDAWMVQNLTGEGLPEIKGRVVCAEVMDRPEHWRE